MNTKAHNASKWIVIIISILIISCNSHPEMRYSKYRVAEDTEQYKRAIEALLELIEYDKRSYVRHNAAEELCEFRINTTEGARDILLEVAVPRLIAAIYNENDTFARTSILEALFKINPEKEVIMPVFIYCAENGIGGEAATALGILRSWDYDLSRYVDKVADKLESSNWSERWDAINALGNMGRYAYSELEKLEDIMNNDPNSHVRNYAEIVIGYIKDDYDKYEEEMNKREEITKE